MKSKESQQASGGTVTSVPGCKTQHAFNSTGLFNTSYPAATVTLDYLLVGGGGGGAFAVLGVTNRLKTSRGRPRG